jgi:hypothetical protein
MKNVGVEHQLASFPFRHSRPDKPLAAQAGMFVLLSCSVVGRVSMSVRAPISRPYTTLVCLTSTNRVTAKVSSIPRPESTSMPTLTHAYSRLLTPLQHARIITT